METRKIPGRIVQCISGLDLPVGTGNHSVGSYCLLQTEKGLFPVQVCSDDLVGHFALEAVDLIAASTTNLASFIRKNCYGG
ncbi:hypothetical protein [Microvirga flavescens]|uniref:hypothetical protein n=1 Tax=Microvirga flavescens TaxID=2249811 RepID=UPI00130061E7|nr:hypothetical protein [Microvirga flavescens]